MQTSTVLVLVVGSLLILFVGMAIYAGLQILWILRRASRVRAQLAGLPIVIHVFRLMVSRRRVLKAIGLGRRLIKHQRSRSKIVGSRV